MRNSKFLIAILFFVLTGCGKDIAPNHPGQTASLMHGAKENQHSNWTGVNSFDLGVIHFFQNYSHKSIVADDFFRFFTYNNFFQGGVLLMAFWWLWFLPGDQSEQERRSKIILALFSSLVAIFIGRVVVHVTPERVRPFINPQLSLVLPYGVQTDNVDHLSSFPSDHAVLFYSIVTGLFLVSKRIGIIALIYTSVFIILTRVYFCYHYATDVIVGGIVGFLTTYLICKNQWFQKIGREVYYFSKDNPQFFYPGFFLLSYQLANLFEELRSAMAFFWQII